MGAGRGLKRQWSKLGTRNSREILHKTTMNITCILLLSWRHWMIKTKPQIGLCWRDGSPKNENICSLSCRSYHDFIVLCGTQKEIYFKNVGHQTVFGSYFFHRLQ